MAGALSIAAMTNKISSLNPHKRITLQFHRSTTGLSLWAKIKVLLEALAGQSVS